MRKEYYDVYKKLGLCVSCGKNTSEEGKVQCLECAVKDSSKKKNYDKERKAKYNKRKKELCDAFGICTTCLKREVVKGKQCLECYVKRRRKYQEKQIEKNIVSRELRAGLGLCFYCGEPVVPGKKVCYKHIITYQEKASHARKHINKETHKWKQDIYVDIMKTKRSLNVQP